MTRHPEQRCLATAARSRGGDRSQGYAGLLILALWWGMSVLTACSEGAGPRQVSTETPAELQVGENKFNTHCAACHGQRGTGTDQGPPLVHKIYEPSHHGDGAFYLAVTNGVRAHHWNFGNMPTVEGVPREDVTQIILYVRWLQRQAGIT